MPAFICQRSITLENRGFYLSGSRLAMEKLDLHFLETGRVSQFLSKTYKPWKHVNIHQLRTFLMWRSIKYQSIIYKYCPRCSYTSVSRVQLLIIYSKPKLLLSHLSLFISKDSTNFLNSTFGAVFLFLSPPCKRARKH